MKKFAAFFLIFTMFVMPVRAAATLADGTYTANLTMTGGGGKAYIQSPAELTVENGEITATLVWSSSNYDRMTVDGVDYFPITLEDGATFQVPVTLDTDMVVLAETVAMSTPHEIEYTLHFDSASLTPLAEKAPAALWLAVGAAVAVVGAVGGFLWVRKRKSL